MAWFCWALTPRKNRPTLVIPHRVWTELLIGKDAFKRRWALTKFPFLLGMDMANIFDELAQRSEGQIRSFEPIFPRKGIRHERLYDTFLHSLPAQRTRAIEHKEHGAEYRERVLREMPALRKKHRDRANAAKSRGETEEYEEWHTIQDCEHHLFLKEDAGYRLWLIEEVSTDADGKPRSIAATCGDAMFNAAWANPMLRRFLRMQATVRLGYANVWEDSKLNCQPRIKNDDDPDIQLVLYARDGDTILTRDKITAYRIRFIDAEKSINVTTWDAWRADSGWT